MGGRLLAEEYGGKSASLVEWLIFEEEYYRVGAPRRVGQNGIFLLAPTIFEFGTEEQRERILPRMACGDDIWSQAWSEPGAGSDLAAIRSTATKVDGGWVLSGQKTWSTRAVFADWAFGLFRSDPEAPRHAGLTYFLFPLDAKGVTVRPIRQLDGEAGFAEIFCDDVFVPDEDVLGDARLGLEGRHVDHRLRARPDACAAPAGSLRPPTGWPHWPGSGRWRSIRRCAPMWRRPGSTPRLTGSTRSAPSGGCSPARASAPSRA